MVGVPHSTGCSLCRERRIKCDKATPSCTQCRKYGRPCPGYTRTYRFQDERPALERRHASSTSPSASTASNTSPGGRGRTASNAAAAAAAVVRDNALAMMHRTQEVHDHDHEQGYANAMAAQFSTGSDFENTSSMNNIGGSPFQNTTPSMDMNMNINMDIDTFIRTVFHTHYHHNLPRLPFESPNQPVYISRTTGLHAFQETSISSLLCIHLAHSTSDPSLLKRSRHLYAQALREVVAGLYTATALSDAMLTSIMMLSVYEMYARTQTGAWAVHVDGVRRLMRSRGAEGHKEGVARGNFLFFRGFLVLAALEEGRACFLEEEGWRGVWLGIAREDIAAAVAVGGGEEEAGRWVDVEERVFGEVVRLPGLVFEARQGDDKVGREMGRARQRLVQLGMELRAGIETQAPRVRVAGGMMPDRGPWLLLQGVESAVALLDGALARRRSDGRFRPFRVVCGLNDGPSAMPRIEGITWLDQVASSLGMIGTMVVDGH